MYRKWALLLKQYFQQLVQSPCAFLLHVLLHSIDNLLLHFRHFLVGRSLYIGSASQIPLFSGPLHARDRARSFCRTLTADSLSIVRMLISCSYSCCFRCFRASMSSSIDLPIVLESRVCHDFSPLYDGSHSRPDLSMAPLEGSEAHLSRHSRRDGCNHKLALVVKVAIDDAIVTDEAVALQEAEHLRRARGTSWGKRRHREPRSPLTALAPSTHAPVTSCSLASRECSRSRNHRRRSVRTACRMPPPCPYSYKARTAPPPSPPPSPPSRASRSCS